MITRYVAYPLRVKFGALIELVTEVERREGEVFVHQVPAYRDTASEVHVVDIDMFQGDDLSDMVEAAGLTLHPEQPDEKEITLLRMKRKVVQLKEELAAEGVDVDKLLQMVRAD